MDVTYIQHCGTDNSVVNAARVSFKKVADNYTEEQNAKLIRYLARNNHRSPFNHSFLTLHIKAPIFVPRQLVKHKFMPWNEVSRRYVDDEPEFFMPEKWRKKAENKKQGSSDEEVTKILFEGIAETWWDDPSNLLQANNESSLKLYKALLYAGIAPEQARMVLPLNTYTEWYWSGTLGAWADMYNLRKKEDTQWETRQIALKCGEIIQPLFPVSWEALTNGRS